MTTLDAFTVMPKKPLASMTGAEVTAWANEIETLSRAKVRTLRALAVALDPKEKRQRAKGTK